MNTLFRNVKVIQSESPFNGQTIDIFIKNGIISKIGSYLPAEDAEQIDMQGAMVSAGWFDFQVQSGEPGFEYKETYASLCEAALDGGFTSVMLMPDGQPCMDNKAAIDMVARRTENYPLHVLSAGALSKGMKGEELSEMYDLHLAGCVAYTDNAHAIKNSKLVLLAGQYAHSFNKPLLITSMDAYLAKGASVNEGPEAVNLGMKGIPTIAEDVAVQRDVAIALYADVPLHFLNVSSVEAIDYIHENKNKGAKLSTSLAAHYLHFSDQELKKFDVNYKVFPPLRSNTEREKLIQAVKFGKIDVLCSNHIPEDRENKIIEFEKGAFGTIGVQSFFGSVYSSLKDHCSLENIIATFTSNPRKILGIKLPIIKEGETAELTFFNTTESWEFSLEKNKSKSENSAYLGVPLLGKPLGIYSKNTWKKSNL